jgi:predicted transcriptional regulator
MKIGNVSRPTDSEFEILTILWEHGPGTVRQVHDRLSETKPSQYTTTLKLLQIMTKKGLVERDESERSHVYRAAAGREEVLRQMAGQLLNRVFGGSARNLLLGALSAKRATKKELAELRELIDEHEKGRKR